MDLDAAQHVARTCKSSSLDPATRSPTPSSFQFRKDSGSWKEGYLSVNWLELLEQSEVGLPEKLKALRAYFLSNPPYSHLKPSKTAAFAVLNVGTVQAGAMGQFPTHLRCQRAAEGEDDPHAGIYPNPGVEAWKADPNDDDPEHLAVQQFLFQSMCHHEPAYP